MATYDFCPKCGSITKEGECENCGFKVPGYVREFTEADGTNKKVEVNNEGMVIEETVKVSYEPAPAISPVPVQPAPQPRQVYYNQGQGYSPNSYAPNTYAPNGYAQPAYNPNQYGYAQPPKKKDHTVGIIIGVVAGIILLCIIIIWSAVHKIQNKWNEVTGDISDFSDQIDEFDWNSLLPDGYGFDYGDDYGYDGSDGGYGDYGDYDPDYNGTGDVYLSIELATMYDKLISGKWDKMDKAEYKGDKEAYDFVDYVDDSVKYTVERGIWNYDNSDGHLDIGDTVYSHNFYGDGEIFRVSDTGLANEEEINHLIYAKSCLAMDAATGLLDYYDNVIYGYCESYVTYMDGDVLSICFYAHGYVYEDGLESSKTHVSSMISSINFDMNTGKEIKASETFEFGGDFYRTFKNKCQTQNGAAVDYYEDEDLKVVLTSDATVVWFYTPIGLEVGVNRPYYGGWSTCSFTDYSKYLKIY